MPVNKVVIGCRLPHGITLTNPNSKDPENPDRVTLAGYWSNKMRKADGSPYQDFALTEVDAEFWETWKIAYRTFKPLQTGAIFEARTQQDAEVKAKDYRKQKTGFEPKDPNSLGVKTAVA